MNNKIFIYLFNMKIKYILINVLFVVLFVQFINLIEISRIIESNNANFFSIIYLSILKLPSIIIEVIPFVIVISTAFIYRNLISNNEMIAMRNIGHSIIAEAVFYGLKTAIKNMRDRINYGRSKIIHNQI